MKKTHSMFLVVFFFLCVVIFAGCVRGSTQDVANQSNLIQEENLPELVEPQNQSPEQVLFNAPMNTAGEQVAFSDPLDHMKERSVIKPFGIYITPQNSPVQPEKFTGYHTGLDFEIRAGESNIDVPVYSICVGEIMRKTTASGYGGYVVQSCQYNGSRINVIYGHVRLSQIKKGVGDTLGLHEVITVLGTGNSSETDGERKHLHLAIQKGDEISIKGYVQSQRDLEGWIDPEPLFPFTF